MALKAHTNIDCCLFLGLLRGVIRIGKQRLGINFGIKTSLELIVPEYVGAIPIEALLS